jgi:hypothetical protein
MLKNYFKFFISLNNLIDLIVILIKVLNYSQLITNLALNEIFTYL